MEEVTKVSIVKYRNKITLLSFVLAMLIVLRHSVGIDVYTLDGVIYLGERFISDATDLVVPMFFALSGFLFYQNFDYSKLEMKLQSRIKTLFVPYIIWNLIGFLFVIVLVYTPFVGERMNRILPPFEFAKYIKSIFWDCEYNALWFIRDLLIFTFVTPIMQQLIGKKFMGGGILLLVLGLGYYINNGTIFYWSVYLFGTYFALNFKSICQMQYDRHMVVCAQVILFISLMAQTYLEMPQGTTVIPLRLIQVALIWIASDFLSVNLELKWWMHISFFIYVSHSIVLESVEKLFWITFGNTTLGALLDLAFAPVITLLIVCFFALILRRVPSLWRILNGGRGV